MRLYAAKSVLLKISSFENGMRRAQDNNEMSKTTAIEAKTKSAEGLRLFEPLADTIELELEEPDVVFEVLIPVGEGVVPGLLVASPPTFDVELAPSPGLAPELKLVLGLSVGVEIGDGAVFVAGGA
jgi:hypothetical protein